MKTVTLIELSSGFGNISNTIIPIDAYTSYLRSRSNSGYDKNLGEFELPEGFCYIALGEESGILDSENQEWNFGKKPNGTVFIRKGFKEIFLRKAKSGS